MSRDGPSAPSRNEIQSLRDLSPHQWKSAVAAWLGWLFDGLDMHLYVLVAAPFVAELIGVSDTRNENVGRYSSWIQAAFLVGWAIGGGFFGRIGDRIGRSRTLSLTILTYALFTGLAFFAQTWWQLLVVRFLAALGIGGEWAVGASLLAETWPRRWRPWIAAALQSGVNIGHPAGLVHDLPARRPEPPRGLPRGRAASPARLLDSQGSARDRRMALGPARGEGRPSRHRRPVPGRGPPHGRPHHPGLLRQPDGALGFSVLVPAPFEELAGRDPPAPRPEERTGQHGQLPGDGGRPLRELRRGGAGPGAGLPAVDRAALSCLLPGHDRDLQRASHPPDPPCPASGPGRLWRPVRAVHDVSAAAVPGSPEDHGGRLLLHHRPPRRGGRNRGLRAVLEGGRLPDRPPLRRLPLLAGDDSCLVAPRSP